MQSILFLINGEREFINYMSGNINANDGVENIYNEKCMSDYIQFLILLENFFFLTYTTNNFII